MKHSIRRLIAQAAVVFTLAASAPLAAQQWSEAQKEVWKNVETYSKLAAEGDLEGFLSYYHPDFLGWDYQTDLPDDKTSRSKWRSYSFQTTKTLVYEVKPVGIKIHGNVAIVHYYYHGIVKDAEDRVIVNRASWTDILLKQGDKWVMIADHGGVTSKN